MSKSVAIIGSRGYPSFYGGFETLVRRLAPYLADAGWDVSVYGRPGATSDAVARHPQVKCITTHGVENKSLSTLTFGLTAALDAQKKRPDVALVLNVANGYWLPLLKARGIPVVVNVDGIEWERAKWGKGAKAVFRGGARLTGQLATTLVCDSREIGRRWKWEYGRDSEFIPYGGDPIDAGDPPLGLTKRGYVLMVARFVPENTVAEFFQAAEKLADTWDVVIVGSSGYGGEFDDQAASLARHRDRVNWLGHLSDDRTLFNLWANAGAYFHGHSVGGTNPALVQAMACGAPIVARDTVYNREVLGDAGRFVAPEPGAIEAAVRGMLSNSDEQEGCVRAARLRALQSYSWNDVCERYMSVMESVLAPELRAPTE
jgi:glycosyltransferase involved in cell wall biosynthesis